MCDSLARVITVPYSSNCILCNVDGYSFVSIPTGLGRFNIFCSVTLSSGWVVQCLNEVGHNKRTSQNRRTRKDSFKVSDLVHCYALALDSHQFYECVCLKWHKTQRNLICTETLNTWQCSIFRHKYRYHDLRTVVSSVELRRIKSLAK